MYTVIISEPILKLGRRTFVRGERVRISNGDARTVVRNGWGQYAIAVDGWVRRLDLNTKRRLERKLIRIEKRKNRIELAIEHTEQRIARCAE